MTTISNGNAEIASLRARCASLETRLKEETSAHVYTRELLQDRVARAENNDSNKKRADAETSRSHEMLAGFMDAATDGFAILDQDLRFLDINPKGAENIFRPKSEIVGRLYHEVIPPSERTKPSGLDACKEVLRTGTAMKFDGAVFKEATGRVQWLTGQAFPVGKNRVGMIVSNITERVEAEQARRQHQAELARVLRMGTMGEMASSLAHEVNQPLAAIYNYSRGCLRRLTSGKSSPSEFRPALEQISEQAERASAVVRKIADFVRKGEPAQAPTDLNELVHSVARLVGAELGDGQVRLKLELGNLIPVVEIDRIEIEQVLLNIVRNSIEAMQETPLRDRTLAIATRQPSDDEIEITVRDTGPGLPDLAGEIFEAFFSTKQGGMGMGLAISRTIMDAHGGRVWAEQGAPCGAVFHITLPVECPTRSFTNARI